jgi:hypothetical protein
MEVIYKYQVQVAEEQIIRLPEDSEILTVQNQAGLTYLWVKHDTDKPLKDYRFLMIGTGHPIDEVFNGKYIGTFQKQGGTLIFHLFLDLGF